MKPFRLLLIVFVLAVLVTPAFGGGRAPSKAPSAQQEAPATDHMQGKVDVVDERGSTVRFVAPTGQAETVTVYRPTKILDVKGEEIPITGLKKGDEVKASWHRVGNENVANEIQVIKAAPAPAKTLPGQVEGEQAPPPR